MLALLALVAPALAVDVDLHISPPKGQDVWVTFHGVTPGTQQTVSAPCARAPSCRMTVTITPEGEQWRIAVNVSEVRRDWLGRERVSVISDPTFVAATEQVATMFVGRNVAVPGSNPATFQEVGLHVEACVRAGPAS